MAPPLKGGTSHGASRPLTLHNIHNCTRQAYNTLACTLHPRVGAPLWTLEARFAVNFWVFDLLWTMDRSNAVHNDDLGNNIAVNHGSLKCSAQ